ncbi:MAG: hypothetical protein WCD66_06410 [Rhodanobacteraceae bacterium]
MLAVVSTSSPAQRIDTNQSRNVSLTDAQAASTGLPAAKQQEAVMSPVMTRAIAHRGADGKLTVDCQVQASPMVANVRPELPQAARRKSK